MDRSAAPRTSRRRAQPLASHGRPPTCEAPTASACGYPGPETRRVDLLIARSEARGDLDLVARLHGLDKQQFTQLLREHPTLVDDFLSFLSNPGRAA